MLVEASTARDPHSPLASNGTNQSHRMADTLVTTVNVPVYGDDDKYPLNLIDKRSFGRWAVHVDQLLAANSKLAKEKLIPRDSITKAAKEALWNTISALASVPKDYESESMASARAVGTVSSRVHWNSNWLKKIAHACAPDTALQVLSAIREIRFGDNGEGDKYTSQEVLRYTASLYDLQYTFGQAMSGLDRKRKLSVITGALPPEIQRILKDTAPAVGPDGGPFQDDWEKGLARVAAEMMKVEDSEIVMSAMQKQGRSASKQDAPYQRHEFDETKVKMGFLNKKFSLGAYGPVQKKGPQQSHGQPRGGQPFGRTRGRLMGTGGKKDHRREFFLENRKDCDHACDGYGGNLGGPGLPKETGVGSTKDVSSMDLGGGVPPDMTSAVLGVGTQHRPKQAK